MDGNIAEQLAAFDNGELDNHDIINLFQDLVSTGLAFTLPEYADVAAGMIEAGVISKN